MKICRANGGCSDYCVTSRSNAVRRFTSPTESQIAARWLTRIVVQFAGEGKGTPTLSRFLRALRDKSNLKQNHATFTALACRRFPSCCYSAQLVITVHWFAGQDALPVIVVLTATPVSAVRVNPGAAVHHVNVGCCLQRDVLVARTGKPQRRMVRPRCHRSSSPWLAPDHSWSGS